MHFLVLLRLPRDQGVEHAIVVAPHQEHNGVSVGVVGYVRVGGWAGYPHGIDVCGPVSEPECSVGAVFPGNYACAPPASLVACAATKRDHDAGLCVCACAHSLARTHAPTHPHARGSKEMTSIAHLSLGVRLTALCTVDLNKSFDHRASMSPMLTMKASFC